MQNLGRELRKADMDNALEFASVSDHKAAMRVLNEVEDELALERKRMSFMVYYGRFMVIDDNSNYWMESVGEATWKTAKFRSAQEAVDAGMAHVKWAVV
jgi:hypothetical protein